MTRPSFETLPEDLTSVKLHRAALMAGLFASAASLAACKGSEAPAPQESSSAATNDAMGPDAKPGVSAGGGRLVLPVVPGRPGVAYFRVGNNTSERVMLAGVHVQGVGKTELHKTSGGQMSPVEQVEIAPGAVITLAPGGLHVMAFDIADTLKPGAQTELTMTFADGDKISIPLQIETMGAAAGASH
jgi:copper(I)-binding protein